MWIFFWTIQKTHLITNLQSPLHKIFCFDNSVEPAILLPVVFSRFEICLRHLFGWQFWTLEKIVCVVWKKKLCGNMITIFKYLKGCHVERWWGNEFFSWKHLKNICRNLGCFSRTLRSELELVDIFVALCFMLLIKECILFHNDKILMLCVFVESKHEI